MKLRIYYITITLAFLLLSCEKRQNKNVSPYSIDLNLNLDTYPDLKNGLNVYKVCPDDLHSQYEFRGGSPAGVIVYHTPLDFYAVYDRCCRNEACEKDINRVPKEIAVVPDGEGYAVCPRCEAKYLLYMGDGQAISGKSKKALWVYPQPVERNNHLMLGYTPK